MRLVHLLVFLVFVVCISGRPMNNDTEDRRLLKGSQPLKRHQRHHDTGKRRNNKHRRPGPHQRSLKEVDYSSDDADDLMKNLANNDVARRSPAAGKASQVTPIIKPSKNDRALKRQNKKKRKNRKNRKTKRNGGGDASVVKGRRWTRRSEESDPFNGGSSQLLGLGVFGDMRKFFDELRTNLPDPDKNQGDDISPDGLDGRDNAIESEQPELEEFPNYQALRSDLSSRVETERRQSRLRGFVSMTEPLRKSRHNQYDPALLWTGLG